MVGSGRKATYALYHLRNLFRRSVLPTWCARPDAGYQFLAREARVKNSFDDKEFDPMRRAYPEPAAEAGVHGRKV
jgi:hypothetical protein